MGLRGHQDKPDEMQTEAALHTHACTHTATHTRAGHPQSGICKSWALATQACSLPRLVQGELWVQLLLQGLPLLRSASLHSYPWILDARVAMTDTF